MTETNIPSIMVGGVDIFNLPVSTVSHDMAGKTILIYGSNRTGKTQQSCKFPKPIYLGFENGLNGIAGVPYKFFNTWGEYLSLMRALLSPQNIEKTREVYQTFIFDTVQAAALLCQDYICGKYGVSSIKEGNSGYGLWTEYETEFKRQINNLVKGGFTVIFISHETTRDFTDENGKTYSKIYPAGDKRSIDPVCDAVDIIAYASVNGLDEEGNEIKSSLYMKNTKKYHAGSRFSHLPAYLPEFTAEALQEAIKKATIEEEQATGVKTVSYEEQIKAREVEKPDFETVKEQIGKYAMALNKLNRMDEYNKIVSNYLKIKVSAAEPTQLDQLIFILEDLQQLKDIDITKE